MSGGEDSQVYGRYALYGEIASGGMATVHYGRLLGQVGFSRPVAIKRLLPELAGDPDFVKMFLEEARLAARVRHPNVVPALDVVSLNDEILLVMDYVHGETLSRLVRVAKRLGEQIPPRIAVGIMCGALEGLHAAHEAKSEKGLPLGLVHRDVSPQNIMVGTDGVTRVLDFGVAKATAKRTETRGDLIKGKAAYMAPEQLVGGHVDLRADIFGASVCLWQALTGERLFAGDSFEAIAQAVVTDPIRPPSQLVPNVPRALDEVLMKGLDREAEHRWPTAREMAIQLERAMQPATVREIGAWVDRVAGDKIHARARVVQQIERVSIASINMDGNDGPDSKREEEKIPDLVQSASNIALVTPPPTPASPSQLPPPPSIYTQQPNPPVGGPPPAPPPVPVHAQGGASSASGPQMAMAEPQMALMQAPPPSRNNLKLILSVVGLTVGVGVGLLIGMRALQEKGAQRAALSADTSASAPPTVPTVPTAPATTTVSSAVTGTQPPVTLPPPRASASVAPSASVKPHR
jgi:serine/threonine-protein kinase